MILKVGLLGALVMVSVLPGCSGSKEEDTRALLDSDQATLVAALAANEDGSDAAWTSASGGEPFSNMALGRGPEYAFDYDDRNFAQHVVELGVDVRH